MVTFSCELRYDGVGFKAYLLDAQDFNDLEKVAAKLELKGELPVRRLMRSKSLQTLFGHNGFKSPRVLVSKVGYSNPMVTLIPEDITVKVLESAKSKSIIIFGTDRSRVGTFAARVRSLKVPERYKGKGILYADEVINLKEGKRK